MSAPDEAPRTVVPNQRGQRGASGLPNKHFTSKAADEATLWHQALEPFKPPCSRTSKRPQANLQMIQTVNGMVNNRK